jgi:hypothetical protein
MTERPILFSAPMVRALLAGTKTQTRRIVKFPATKTRRGEWEPMTIGGAGITTSIGTTMPPGAAFGHSKTGAVFTYCLPGDRLWVRETSIIAPKNWNDGDLCTHTDSEGVPRLVQYLATSPDREAANDFKLKATPSIFMPRWASRISLDVTGVRVERLNDISETDAVAEGVPLALDEDDEVMRSQRWAIQDYRGLWESINGAGSWAKNPLVWVVEFKRIAP